MTLSLTDAIYSLKLETVNRQDKVAGRDMAGSREVVAQALRSFKDGWGQYGPGELDALAQAVARGARLSNTDWAMLETVLEHG